jgi:hypothetical protein
MSTAFNAAIRKAAGRDQPAPMERDGSIGIGVGGACGTPKPPDKAAQSNAAIRAAAGHFRTEATLSDLIGSRWRA